jgi:tRNA threonylcarbamoyl adenosine modification protein (Sua5/YciO/YrdC/YwlC family)
MKTEVLKLPPEGFDPTLLEKPAAVLRAGGLVAFPTETVYGIGANPAMAGAVERLLQVRGSPAEKHLTLHLADIGDVARHVPGPIPPIARRLMKRFWPGPLTIVVPTADGRGVGLRVPANRIASDLIARAGVAVVVPSANRSGEPPAVDAAAVMKAFDGQIEWVVDGGPTRFGKASTVVRVQGRSCEVLREGVIPTSLVTELAFTTILFICTGNTCRSPMAAALFRARLARGHGWSEDDLEAHGFRVLSAGTAALPGGPASPAAIDAVREHSARLEGHVAQPVTVTMVEEADLVYVMTEAHLRTLREWVPGSADKIRLLDPGGSDVEDPIGGSPSRYRECASRLGRCVEAAVREIAPLQP